MWFKFLYTISKGFIPKWTFSLQPKKVSMLQDDSSLSRLFKHLGDSSKMAIAFHRSRLSNTCLGDSSRIFNIYHAYLNSIVPASRSSIVRAYSLDFSCRSS